MAQVLTISAGSIEYVLVPIQNKVGGINIDPTGDTVSMAFVAPGTSPQSGDWKTASWEVTIGQFGAANTYSTKCLIGPPPGLIALAPGGYSVFSKLQDQPEVIVKKSGELRII